MEIENPAIKFDYYLLEKNAALAIDLLYYTGTITLLVSITTDKYRPARIKSCDFQRCWVSSLLNVKKNHRVDQKMGISSLIIAVADLDS